MSWLNDLNTIANNHAGFNLHMDGAMSYLQPPQTINPAQFQNQPYLNGAVRTSSPAFHNPIYQTNSIIPAKRPREENIGTSPHQNSGGLPGARSQTPGQAPYPGFNPQQNGAPQFQNAPTPFQHLQHTTNATPSPTIQQMSTFGQGGVAQRVSTASPNAFSPQHGPPHASPAQDHNSRTVTPHDLAQAQMPMSGMPNNAYGPGFHQHQNSGSMNMNMNAAMNMIPQHGQNTNVSLAARHYQLQMQQSARQMQAQQQGRSMNGQTGPPGPNPAMANMGQAALGPGRLNNPEDFAKGLQAFMASKGRTVDIRPVICGQTIQLMKLYVGVIKAGGSNRVSKMNQWSLVANSLGFLPQLQAQAAQELQTYWSNNLSLYETAWLASQQKQRMAAQAGGQGQMQNQMSPTKNSIQPPAATNHQRNHSDLMNVKAQQMLNDFGTPMDLNQQQSTPQHKANLSQQFEAQLNGIPQGTQKGLPVKTEPAVKAEPESNMPIRKPIQDPFEPEALPPSRFHGPINVDEMFVLGGHVAELKPTSPNVRELGVIDIHALTMAIKSGMHGETRVALDTLVTLSTEPTLQLSLSECEDLMETLVDCAQDQIDFLAEHSAEVSDDMLLPSYEELVRSCRVEAESLQSLHRFGSLQYDLDRAADRLICITTLMRNFSFYEANFGVLGQPEVLKMLSTVIRYLGTKESLLRTLRNTIDFFKDVVIYLSNLSTSLNLPGKEEALCILHLLLAFAPTPAPVSTSSDKVVFTMYNPNVHKYLPSAVDSLAKLLARDEPNRTYYKAIFHADANSIPSFELLTRTFGLAIAPIPSGTAHVRAIVEARKPFLLQGMLAAEILAGLAPASDHPLARSWLESQDKFAASLLKLVNFLGADKSTQTNLRHVPQQGRNVPEADANAYGAITNRAMAVLKSLVQKARTVDGDGIVSVPVGVLPKKETILGAMVAKDIDAGLLKQLCMYAGMED